MVQLCGERQSVAATHAHMHSVNRASSVHNSCAVTDGQTDRQTVATTVCLSVRPSVRLRVVYDMLDDAGCISLVCFILPAAAEADAAAAAGDAVSVNE